MIETIKKYIYETKWRYFIFGAVVLWGGCYLSEIGNLRTRQEKELMNLPSLIEKEVIQLGDYRVEHRKVTPGHDRDYQSFVTSIQVKDGGFINIISYIDETGQIKVYVQKACTIVNAKIICARDEVKNEK